MKPWIVGAGNVEAEKTETAWAEAILAGLAEAHSPNAEVCEACKGRCKYFRASNDCELRNGIWRVSLKSKQAGPLKQP